ncbi:unnamed protein product [Protopolystoma xenopodis]|uniref:Uncharacterized protein n=1 Tax=Protopolystoma xenopodis TaxID=117903 RepID=A0A448WVE9_9PLAT|nr:unnamed protein product [Protopolystoma xenopodis]
MPVSALALPIGAKSHQPAAGEFMGREAEGSVPCGSIHRRFTGLTRFSTL